MTLSYVSLGNAKEPEARASSYAITSSLVGVAVVAVEAHPPAAARAAINQEIRANDIARKIGRAAKILNPRPVQDGLFTSSPPGG
jgi:hypothetical protein